MPSGTHLVNNDFLLEEGRYKEWFYSNLSAEAEKFFKAKPYTGERTCRTCRQLTPGDLLISDRCRRCRLKGPKIHDQHGRWHNREELSWMLEAACQAADLEIFFPANRATAAFADAEWRDYCTGCPVSGPCRLYAVDSNSVGVFGGVFFADQSDQSREGTSGRIGRPRKFPRMCNADKHELKSQDDVYDDSTCKVCKLEKHQERKRLA